MSTATIIKTEADYIGERRADPEKYYCFNRETLKGRSQR